jgi:hypothetical protein
VHGEHAKALAENQQLAAEHSKIQEEHSRVTEELQHAHYDIEQLFYAVQLLVRGLRVYRVRLSDLCLQKHFLSEQLQLLQSVQLEIYQLVESMTRSPLHPLSTKKHASFRAAGIAVIAAGRLLRLQRTNSQLHSHHLLKQRVSIAPSHIISHVNKIPSLPTPPHTHLSSTSSVQPQEVEALLKLINHFDPFSEVEDKLYSSSLLLALDIGLRDFSYRQRPV